MRSVFPKSLLWPVVAVFAVTLGACGAKEKSHGDKRKPDPGSANADGADGEVDGGTPADGTPSPAPSQPPPGSPPPSESYDRTVSPTLESIQSDLVNPFCVPCHSGESPAKGVDLSNLKKYVDGGPLTRDERLMIVPGAPDFSLIVRVLEDTQNPMPPIGNGLEIPPVKSAQKDSLKSWIQGLTATVP